MKSLVKKSFLLFLISLLLVMATACAPSSLKSCKNKMENAGYSVYDYESYREIDGCKGGVVATIYYGKPSYLNCLLFEDAKSAKAYYGKLKQGWLENVWVVWGTDDAYKVFKR